MDVFQNKTSQQFCPADECYCPSEHVLYLLRSATEV